MIAISHLLKIHPLTVNQSSMIFSFLLLYDSQYAMKSDSHYAVKRVRI